MTDGLYAWLLDLSGRVQWSNESQKQEAQQRLHAVFNGETGYEDTSAHRTEVAAELEKLAGDINSVLPAMTTTQWAELSARLQGLRKEAMANDLGFRWRPLEELLRERFSNTERHQ